MVDEKGVIHPTHRKIRRGLRERRPGLLPGCGLARLLWEGLLPRRLRYEL